MEGDAGVTANGDGDTEGDQVLGFRIQGLRVRCRVTMAWNMKRMFVLAGAN